MKKEGVSELEDRPKIILAEEETKTAGKKKKEAQQSEGIISTVRIPVVEEIIEE